MAVPAAFAVIVLAVAGLAPMLGDSPFPPVDPAPGSEPRPPAPDEEPVDAVTPPTPDGREPSDDGASDAPHAADPPQEKNPLDAQLAGAWAPADATHNLAYRLAAASSGADVREAIVEHLYVQGFPVPPPRSMQPSPPSQPHFEPNDTLMFTHNVGDADEDGFEDVAINALCVTNACTWSAPRPLLQSIPPRTPEGPTDCRQPQQIYVRSGRDGALLWDIDLSREEFAVNLTDTQSIHDYIFCPVHIVMGTIPVGPQSMDLEDGQLPPTGAKNGTALLVYTLGGVFGPMAPSGAFGALPIATGNPTLLVLEHQVYAFDSATGQRLWTHTEEGRVVMWDGCGVTLYRICTELGTGGTGAITGDRQNSKFVRAQNLLVNPLLMIPRDNGVQVRSEAEPTLMLQGVGFEYDVIMAWSAMPGQTRGNRILDDYRPDEWVGALDLNSGETTWSARTFTPDQTQSVVPSIINAVTPGVPFTFFTGYRYEARVPNPWDFVYNGVSYEVDVIAQNYWRQQLCCYDITGDGIPDIVYTTQEWNPRPMMNEEGPYVLDSRVVAFDGSDGSPLWDAWIARDTPRHTQHEYETLDAYAAHLEVVGDADGDGLDDVLVHKYYLAEDFLHELEVRSGADGSLVWGVRSGQHKLALPLGDADGDGGVDIAMFDWFDWDYPVVKTYDLANVTAHPINVRSGADGHLLWEALTFNAPIDLFYILDGYKISGVNDFDGDGVGDFSVDDPTMLPDQTVVHDLRFLSGSTGRQVFNVRTVGTFAFPIWAGDQNGDGIDEFLVFSGEISDIWVTDYDGASGQALWSQRFMSMNTNDYTLAVPRIGVLGLDSEQGDAPIINYQMRIVRYGGFIFNPSTYPQIRSFHADGVRGWNYPALGDPALYEPVLGATPAATLFAEAVKEQSQNSLTTWYQHNDKPILKGYLPALGAFLAASLVAFKLSNMRRTRRRNVLGRDAEW